MISKRAQGGGAAGLIAIIAGLIILYILFIPADVREGLLNETKTITTASKISKDLGETLLVFEHPGTLDPVKHRDREKILDSFNLYTQKSAVVLKSVQTAHVNHGWLRGKTYELLFDVKEMENTENYILAFDVAKSQGRIKISLNGKEIYNSVVALGNVEPIKIQKDDVTSQNILLFSVSGVGLAFWKLNEYDLQNIRIVADFTDVSKREYKNSFIISATEKENFDKTKLLFIPYCLTDKVGPLTIKINERELQYSAIPDCGLLSTKEFDSNILKQGENIITFRAEEGNYLIDRLSIKSELKELTYPFYYFELEEDDFEKIENEEANVTLELEFADKEDKLGEINVNGHLMSLDTDKISYKKNINVYVEEDQNYIQIVPQTLLSIVDLKVILEK